MLLSYKDSRLHRFSLELTFKKSKASYARIIRKQLLKKSISGGVGSKTHAEMCSSVASVFGLTKLADTCTNLPSFCICLLNNGTNRESFPIEDQFHTRRKLLLRFLVLLKAKRSINPKAQFTSRHTLRRQLYNIRLDNRILGRMIF